MRILALEDLTVTVWLHTRVDPPPDQFDAALAELGRYRRQHSVLPARMRSLVVSDGGAPDSRQRSQLGAALDHAPSRMAVVTTALENPIKRGVATALSWLNPDIRFYQPKQLREAVAYIGLTAHEAALWAQLVEMGAELPRADATLPLIAAATGRSLGARAARVP